MTDNGITLNEYREALKKQGAIVKADTTRLRNSREALKQRVLHALAAGLSENEAHKITGVTRQTIRDWAGK